MIENNTYTNIIDVTLANGNANGISYTVNADKSVTFNGTASENTWIIYGKFNYYKDEKYYFSGCDEVFGYGSLYTNGTLKYANSIMSFDSDGVDFIIIYISSGVTLSNHTLYPMITLGEKKIQWTPPVGSEKLNDIVTKIKNDLSAKLGEFAKFYSFIENSTTFTFEVPDVNRYQYGLIIGGFNEGSQFVGVYCNDSIGWRVWSISKGEDVSVPSISYDNGIVTLEFNLTMYGGIRVITLG